MDRCGGHVFRGYDPNSESDHPCILYHGGAKLLLRGVILLDLPYQCGRPQACVPHMLAPARNS